MKNKNQIWTTIGLFVILVAIISGVIGIYFWPKDEVEDNTSEFANRFYVELKHNDKETYKQLGFNDGEVLQTILDRNYDTGYNEWGMISEIDWLKDDPTTYIAFYINDEYAMEGVGTYTPASLDVITFIIEEITW